MDYKVVSPVLLLVFNRPDTTRRVLEVITRVKPKRLYVSADGPRKSKGQEEKNKTEEVRSLIENGINWNCQLQTLYRNDNIGCRNAVSHGISWFFEQEEQGIILEDDCIVDDTFMRFCDELLEYYKNDERIMHISANNFLDINLSSKHSYYYSVFNHVWGWATWRRAWRYYDSNMDRWSDDNKMNVIKSVGNNSRLFEKYWVSIFNAVKERKIDSWAYIWTMSMWMQHGLSITPICNLVDNIGFDSSATHTKSNTFRKLAINKMTFPLTHNNVIIPNYDADNRTAESVYKIRTLMKRLMYKIRSFVDA